MKLLRSLFFDCLFYLTTTLVALFCLPLLLLPLRHRFIIMQLWGRLSLFLARHVLGLNYHVEGLEHLPVSGPFLIACKHQSAWETFALNAFISPAVFILKRELLGIPLIGFYMKALKCIAVKRGGGSKTVEDMLAQARAVRDCGLSVIIFPEGTRSSVGQKSTYRQGIGILYEELQLPVVPIALNSGLFWGRRSVIKKAGHITVQILPAILPGMPREAFMKLLETTIESAVTPLCADAPSLPTNQKVTCHG